MEAQVSCLHVCCRFVYIMGDLTWLFCSFQYVLLSCVRSAMSSKTWERQHGVIVHFKVMTLACLVPLLLLMLFCTRRCRKHPRTSRKASSGKKALVCCNKFPLKRLLQKACASLLSQVDLQTLYRLKRPSLTIRTVYSVTIVLKLIDLDTELLVTT